QPVPQLGRLLRGHVLELGHVPYREEHQVPARVRVGVQDGGAQAAAPHDIGVLGQYAAQHAPFLARRPGDVLAAPARPDPLEVHPTALVSTSTCRRVTKSSTDTPRSTSPPRGLTPTVPSRTSS